MEEKKYAEIQIDISDEDFLILAKLSHEQDVTFNQLVNNILNKAVLNGMTVTKVEDIKNKEDNLFI